MEKLTKVFIFIAGWGFILTALSGMFFPQEFTDLAGIHLTSVSALNEIRANYGGMHLLMGLYVLYLGWRQTQVETALWITGLFCIGYVLGRIISIGVDGIPNDVIFFYTLIELAGAMGAFALLAGRRGELLTDSAVDAH